ncbi:MAG: UvrABC system protein B [Berkelbacteria bacterium GW2011_GWB1_38_5]|uniref:UvrABC system protein B n=2 Tax=Candidatus Berkelbacteria TaxID=1618330 RepID=A0A0G0NYA3_9BACT|nr:MAG: UvrABC system protein B [Berkelbacteria bacterium GW2011_GWB1_38_5]KKQ90799.1 MAG: UvrABC system protein B [Berkelbacteria bacterium GW2011_GWA1_39_10]
MKFKLSSKYKPAGDQPQAIEKLVSGLKKGYRNQTLLGVTGSGKTFTIANVIEKVQKPTLVIAHNKTLAAQLCSEFRTFFPKSAVEYFVSYYDYYQPEAYLPTTDIYIEKDLEINQEIERLRHAATQALLYRNDVIIVASVSCIYGLGSPEVYKKAMMTIGAGFEIDREEIMKRLVEMYFTRSEVLDRGKFRLHGQTLEIMPADQEIIIRIEFDGNLVKKITRYESITMKKLSEEENTMIFPAKLFVVPEPMLQDAIKNIGKELEERLKYFAKERKTLEAERLNRRTRYDLELMREIGYCSGIENYSRYLTGRKEGQAPDTLMDFFPEDFLLVIDESHVTVSQIGAMFEGDRSRKKSLIDYGFRLPSAFDNRPLKFPEFDAKIKNVIYTSATPAVYERKKSKQIVEQIIRPTGLVDPELEIRPSENQIKDLISEIKERAGHKERTLVTTLTKRMAEDLSEHLKEAKVKAEYLHSEVDTLDRIGILENLRKGEFDCLVGVNLLREGLDLPEVTLVAILDADKEGFLRSETSLIQTIGRAARNVKGKVILYADNITGSMKRAIDETERRRKKQIEFNKKHNITPKTIEKAIDSIIDHELKPQVTPEFIDLEKMEDLPAVIALKQKEMKIASQNLEFEKAAILRDEIIQLRKLRIK